MDFSATYRQTVTAITNAAPVKNFTTRHGWRLGAKRFVAGTNFEETLPVIKQLESEGKLIVLDLLGEFIDDEGAARQIGDEVRAAVRAAADAGVTPYYSVKPTQLGLGISYELAYELTHAVMEEIKATDGHLCLDMESVEYVDTTIQLYEELHKEFGNRVSTVLQSYLFRTKDDLAGILERIEKPTLRIVKGAYNESPEHVWKDLPSIIESYQELVLMLAKAGGHVNVATHDEALIRQMIALFKGAGIENDQFEIQLLYGVKPGLQKKLVEEGYNMRVYLPFGADWYGYFTRRLAERPENLMFVVRGLFG